VRHGHFYLNGRRTDIPSALVKPNDIVEVAPGSRDNEYFKTVRERLAKKTVPRWLDLDLAGMRGRVLSAPGREDIDTSINEQLVVEFYSR
jgi:small subunit ribosomal protein S4